MTPAPQERGGSRAGLSTVGPMNGSSRHEDHPPPKATVAQALSLILTWYTMSTALSLFNKKVLGHKYGIMGGESFPAPLMMSSVQFFGQYGLARLAHSVGVPRHADPGGVAGNPRSWETYSSTVVPVGVATGLDIGFSNVALSFITLSFYTMCKSSAPLFLLLCAFIWRIETPTWQLAGIVSTISIGLLMLVAGEVEKDDSSADGRDAKETDFSLLGFVLVMLAACMSGVRWTIAQLMLQGQNGSGGHHVTKGTALEVMESVTPIMGATAALMSLASEPLKDMIATSVYFASPHNLGITFAIIAVSSAFAFVMVLVEFMLVSRTSALTFMVAGVFKEVLTVVVAHFTYGDEFTWLNGVGMLILIVGVSLFNIHQYRKKQQTQPSHKPALLEEESHVILVSPKDVLDEADRMIELSSYSDEIHEAASDWGDVHLLERHPAMRS